MKEPDTAPAVEAKPAAAEVTGEAVVCTGECATPRGCRLDGACAHKLYGRASASPSGAQKAVAPMDEVVERAAFVAEAKRRGWKPGDFMLGAYAGWLAVKSLPSAGAGAEPQEVAMLTEAEVEKAWAAN